MGASWEYFLYSELDFIKKHPDCAESGAITVPADKTLFFIKNQIDIGTVRHEVRHAFISELCLDSASLELGQFEEVQCTLDQTRWDEMHEVSAKIYKDLTKN